MLLGWSMLRTRNIDSLWYLRITISRVASTNVTLLPRLTNPKLSRPLLHRTVPCMDRKDRSRSAARGAHQGIDPYYESGLRFCLESRPPLFSRTKLTPIRAGGIDLWKNSVSSDHITTHRAPGQIYQEIVSDRRSGRDWALRDATWPVHFTVVDLVDTMEMQTRGLVAEQVVQLDNDGISNIGINGRAGPLAVDAD